MIIEKIKDIYLNMKNLNNNKERKYINDINLCPEDNAENIEPYSNKLYELLKNQKNKVFEIAITSPYSGGKSSFLNTFFKNNSKEFNSISISLAYFKEDKEKENNVVDINNENNYINKDNITHQENDINLLNQIEKSIVQQLLYRTDSKKTSNSRFRRIFQAPISNFESYVFVVNLFIWILLFIIHFKINNTSIKDFSNIVLNNSDIYSFKFWANIYFFSLPIVIVKDLYFFLKKLNINKFNLIKGEVVFEKQKNDSIFNIYLEEIIYYFTTQKSEVVIFEDIDRFNEPDIFIKLKELNKLINDSKDVKQKVRFIYALRDDVFKGKNRTKFFDAIIPIIPITNKFNSFPLLKKLINTRKQKYNDENYELDDDFLREISIYIDDMRMIKNIVSEYFIYADVLKNNNTNLNMKNLFSFIIYKNIYCDDFALLHEDKGILSSFFHLENKFKEHKIEKLIKEIKEKESRLQLSEKELTQSIEELNAYCFILILNKIQSVTNISIQLNNFYINNFKFEIIIEKKNFENLLKDKKPMEIKNSNKSINIPALNKKSFSDILNEVIDDYENRKNLIEIKSGKIKDFKISEIDDLKLRIEKYKNTSTKEFLNDLQEDDWNKNTELEKIKNEKLLIQLLKKGYIDRNYHLYISHFYEGSMTRNDMDYIMSLKDKKHIDEKRHIDNPNEVLKYLSDDEHQYVGFFNYCIINNLIESKNYIPLKSMIKSLFESNQSYHNLILNTFDGIENNKHSLKNDCKVYWVKELIENCNNILIDIINNNNLKENDKNAFIVNFFLFIENNNLNIDDLFKNNKEDVENYINTTESFIFYIQRLKNKDISVLFESFSKLTIKFKNLKNDFEDYFLLCVLKNTYFEINISNFKIILDFLNIETNNLKYSFIKSIDDKDFKNFFSNYIDEIINLISESHISINKDDFDFILMDEKIKLDTKIKLINNVDFKIQKIEKFKENNDLIRQIIINKQFLFNLENIDFIMFSYQWTSETSTLLKIIDEEVENIISIKDLLDKKYKDKYKSLILKNDISFNSFEKYCDFFDIVYDIKDINDNISNKKCNYIVSKLDFNINFYKDIKLNHNALLETYSINNFGKLIKTKELNDLFITNFNEFCYYFYNDSVENTNKTRLIKERKNIIDINNEKFIDYISSGLDFEIDFSLIKKIITKNINVDTKIKILIGQIKYLNKENLKESLIFIDDDFKEITTKSSFVKIKYTKNNEIFIDHLKSLDIFVSTSKVEGKYIKVNLKRKKTDK